MAKRKQATAAEQTSGLETGTGNGLISMDLDPDSILIDPRIHNLREWTGSSQHELEIPVLARMILEGTQEPVLCRQTDAGFVCVSGERRIQAIRFLRENGHEDATVHVVVDPGLTSDSAVFRAAFVLNEHRGNFTDIERARQYAFVRKEMGLAETGTSNGNSRLADFFGVSPATISQKLKLLGLPTNVQAEIQAGRMSGTAALALADQPAADQPRVAQRAAEIAEEEQVEREVESRIAKEDGTGKRKTSKGKSAEDEGGSDNGTITREPTKEMKERTARYRAEIKQQKKEAAEAKAKAAAEGKAAPASTPAASKPASVTKTHVEKAARALGTTDPSKGKAPRMAEACNFFDTLAGEAGQYTPVMCKLASVLSAYGHGKKGERAVQGAWDDLADALATPASAPAKGKSAKQVSKSAPAKKKAAAKPKAKAAKAKAKRK